MHISQILISGYRNHKNTAIQFNDGINVIIGHNNSGKTNLIQALRLVIDQKTTKRLLIDDFSKDISLDDIKQNPPIITISLKISQNHIDDQNNDELSTVASWIIGHTPLCEALLTYKFFLPEKHQIYYKTAIESALSVPMAFRMIEKNFLHLYVAKIFGGNITSMNLADPEDLQKFDFQFLNAIRDVERDLFTGRNSELRKVLEFFIDYEIKSNATTDEEKLIAIRKREVDFSTASSSMINKLQERIQGGKGKILSYAKETGATFNNDTPDFDGDIAEIELLSALRLIIKNETGIEVPATHNGLGYNNLIYISILLAKMQENANSKYLNNESKIFPVLAIEEPEAHLHPSMQYKFLKFLQANMIKNKNQIFITTHSTHITSATPLNNLICLYSDNHKITPAYPGKAFDTKKEGQSSRAYTERFLDATKADMLFSKKVIFVEGIAEQLLIGIFAKYHGKNLEDHHISLINVGGRYFQHFLHIFNSKNAHTLPKKVVCLTDRDPEHQKLGTSSEKFMKCYPFEYKQNNTLYSYKNNSESLIEEYKDHPNIRFFSQSEENGKTLEYEIAYNNPGNKSIITNSVSNSDELTTLIDLYNTPESKIEDFYSTLRSSDENTRIINSLKTSSSSDNEKKKSIISARYLNSIGKGENALELSHILAESFNKNIHQEFIVPPYIIEALDWICQ